MQSEVIPASDESSRLVDMAVHIEERIRGKCRAPSMAGGMYDPWMYDIRVFSLHIIIIVISDGS
jgi:hypothetical protein